MNAKKIMAIFMCMLVMALIPAAAGISDKQTPKSTDMGRTYIVGLIFAERSFGQQIYFRALFVRFWTIGIGERYGGSLHFGEFIHLKSGLAGGHIMYGHIIMGWFRGELVVH